MHSSKGLLFLGILATLSAAPAALAQDYKYDEGNKYNTIGDNPVAVGDKNKYEQEFKKINISTNPMAWMWGTFGASGAYALNQNFALRAELNYASYSWLEPDWADDTYDLTGFEFGVGVPIYFAKAFTGFFVEPAILIRVVSLTYTKSAYSVGLNADGDYESTYSKKTVDTSATVFGPNVMFGYHWMWDSGFNLALAGGVGRNLSTGNDDEEGLAFVSDFFWNGQLNLGYAFN